MTLFFEAAIYSFFAAVLATGLIWGLKAVSRRNLDRAILTTLTRSVGGHVVLPKLCRRVWILLEREGSDQEVNNRAEDLLVKGMVTRSIDRLPGGTVIFVYAITDKGRQVVPQAMDPATW